MRSSVSRVPARTASALPPPALGIDPFVWQGQSGFRQAVYRALCRVPAGRVTTYGGLAAAVGCRSARAVGQALRHNPFAPMVPCHRVVCSDLSLGGFHGQRAGPELARKRALLLREGVDVSADGHLADPARFIILHPQG
jgi:methylated-DNA-[protein]-cysteine S-methyltransferase